MNRKDVDINKVSPMMRQYLEIKNNNEDLFVFFRLGDFYEMFFDDALFLSKELELTLTGKSAGLEEKIPMCGIPHHAVTPYIEKLVEKGYKVGICEQLEDPKEAKGVVKRDIVQIISSGTVIDANTIKQNDFNFIGCIIDLKNVYSISYSDITTGEIYSLIIPHINTLLISEIINLGLKEVIFNSKIDPNIIDTLRKQFKISTTITDEQTDDYNYIYEDIEDERYITSIKHLIAYIKHNQKQDFIHMQKVNIKKNNDYMKMDIHTKRNLELVETLRLKQRNYSLIWLLDKTKTAMGARLLKRYILNPLVNKEKINERYNTVETLIDNFIIKEELIHLLDKVYDLERLSGKVAFGNANARDLLQLKNSLEVLPNISEYLKEIKFHKNLEDVSELYKLLENSIYENPPISIKEGYLIKENYNSELDELKKLRKGGKDFIAKFELEEREKTGIKNLKIAYNKVFGYFIEISKGNIPLVKEEWGYQRKQTLTNCERYISPILKEKEALILNAEEKIVELEYNLFNQIKDIVKTFIPKLQNISKTISEIDVMQSFATVAEENNYVRPKLTNKNINIIDSRHPVVEKVITNYVPNNIEMDENTNILLITGPNMAGKSTYMRQMAITAIMAQIGSYVPAKEANIPVFDAIYTRIGASDDLVSGESTFMVEMTEANNAISNATENSLVLFDELGRGTATYDGMALAGAIIEYINNVKCKTFFSTHYHELTDLENKLNGVKNIHVSAYEEDGKITFLHKIKKGSIDKSYGIHVAKLANLPEPLIKKASEILKIYENKENNKIQETLPIDDLIKQESKIEKEIKDLNVLEITPVEALNILFKLQKEIKNTK